MLNGITTVGHIIKLSSTKKLKLFLQFYQPAIVPIRSERKVRTAKGNTPANNRLPDLIGKETVPQKITAWMWVETLT